MLRVFASETGVEPRPLLVVKGSLLRLHVKDPDGVRRRGYDLQVEYDDGKGHGHVIPDWDVPGVSGWSDGARVRGEHVFVRPGRGRVTAILAGVGRGTTGFEADASGREIDMEIQLVPGIGDRR
jgi:hypothetical protein